MISCQRMSKRPFAAPTTALQVSHFYIKIHKIRTTLNIVPLGHGNQFSIKSWYMPPHMYKKSNQSVGRWSSHMEMLFNLLDQTVVSGKTSITQGPHVRKTWDNQACSSLGIYKARMRLELVGANLFKLRH